MKSTPKWLLIPPAVAVLLILGPLSMQGGSEPADGAPAKASPPAEPSLTQPASTPADAATIRREANTGSLVPRTPDLWKMSSTLIGVLLLGIGGVFVLRRMRGGSPATGSGSLIAVRQTVRLSQRQAVHAIEFDDRILLIGEHERGLCLLDRGRLPDSTSDEHEVLTRRQEATEHEDEGAVPKNLLIPRPDPAPRRPLPTQATAPAARGTKLNDFRSLLQKAGR